MREMLPRVTVSLFLVLWVFVGTNRNIFIAVIYGMAKGSKADTSFYVLESVHDWIKTNFIWKKVGSSYV